MSGRHTSADYRKKALPLSFVRAGRSIQTRRIFQRFVDHFPPAPGLRILDLGVSAAEPRREVHFFENLYPFPDRIVAAGVEPVAEFGRLFPEVRYVELERHRPLPFADQEFDVVFSNAVIEHVGDRAAQRRFLSEILRVGRAAFVTTPNRWYPVELHTMLPLLHYLPVELHRPILDRLGFHFFAREENLNLLDRKSLSALVPPGLAHTIESLDFLGLPANLLLIATSTRPV